MLRLSHLLHMSGDPVARKRHLLAGLCDLLNAESAMSIVAHVEPPRKRETLVSVIHHGVSRVSEKQVLGRCLRSLAFAPPSTDPPPPSAWQPIGGCTRASRSRRLVHCLWRPASGPDARVIACVCLVRSAGFAFPFLARERMLLHLAHMEMNWIYQADLMLASRGPASLSPRQRQTLQYLLAGHSEKEIAEKMHLSRNTVHHHVKAIHKHFAVSSRSELLAKWVRG
ncbi:MAG TPA: helix-turn-helix transcriptional regulator [Tepidisphaeraceae bacterium]|jgi:DNA-binding CsgD family transcriptional regulator|nr:helix-turn-helix transcriptional regulator [Tepidisphaeraceae bacterium]